MLGYKQFNNIYAESSASSSKVETRSGCSRLKDSKGKPKCRAIFLPVVGKALRWGKSGVNTPRRPPASPPDHPPRPRIADCTLYIGLLSAKKTTMRVSPNSKFIYGKASTVATLAFHVHGVCGIGGHFRLTLIFSFSSPIDSMIDC